MITFTDAAKNHIETMLKSKGDNAAFRLSLKKTGCSGYMYVPEIVTQRVETDMQLTDLNFPAYVDSTVLSAIKDTVVDYVKKSLGTSQLEFKNPNAEGVCGCGESFTLKGSV